MLMEHVEGRGHIQALAELAAQETPWTVQDRQRVADAAYGYGNLLRQHIHKEDAILYPMAEQRLPTNLLDRVSAECEAFEAHKTSSGEHERLQRLADELVSRHASLAKRADPQPFFGCHG
jgi:hemerythrin-like domain-containing protein